MLIFLFIIVGIVIIIIIISSSLGVELTLAVSAQNHDGGPLGGGESFAKTMRHKVATRRFKSYFKAARCEARVATGGLGRQLLCHNRFLLAVAARQLPRKDMHMTVFAVSPAIATRVATATNPSVVVAMAAAAAMPPARVVAPRGAAQGPPVRTRRLRGALARITSRPWKRSGPARISRNLKSCGACGKSLRRGSCCGC